MKKEFLTGLTVILLAIGLVLAGCESPTNGSNGGSGTNALPADTATTAAGAEKFWAEGRDIVYFAGALTLGDGGEPSLTVPDGKTLILADVADLYNRAVAASGKGSITVNAHGKLDVGTGTKLAVHNGSSVTVAGGEADLKGAVIVGTPGVVPAAADIPVFAISSGTVTASSAATLSFTDGAKLVTTGGTITANSATEFAFENPAALDADVVTAIAAAGSTALNVGGTIDAGTGKVEVGTGTTIDPNNGVGFASDEATFLADLKVATKVLVSYTGTAPVTISETINAPGTNRVISLTKATLTIAASGGSLTLGATDVINTAGGVVVNGTVNVSSRTTGSFWDAFTGAGLVTVNRNGVINQGSGYGIGGGAEFVNTAEGATITYAPATGLVTIAGGTVSLGHVLELAKPLTVATGATLAEGTHSFLKLRPGLTLTVNGTVTAVGNAATNGAILLGEGGTEAGTYTVNGSGTIKLTSVGSIFAVGASQTLNVTGVKLVGLTDTDNTNAINTAAGSLDIDEIDGRVAALVEVGYGGTTDNAHPLVTVTGAGAVLTLNTGAKVAGNTIVETSAQKEGAGVKVTSGGRLNIAGGEVSYNTIVATSTGIGAGAGVYVHGGTLAMTSGSISKNYIVTNTAYTTGGNPGGYGGGVALSINGAAATVTTFNLSGGSVSDNFIGGSTLNEIIGGGVRVDNGDNTSSGTATLTMTGGSISGNKLEYSGSETTTNRNSILGGAAAAVSSKGTFTISGGTISGNGITALTRVAYGSVYAYGTFEMTGGTIEGNTATSSTSYGTKGVMGVATLALKLSGSAKLLDGITLKPGNTIDTNVYPKITVGTLASGFEVSALDLQARVDKSNNYDDWPSLVILTGSGAVGNIAKFPLGNFILTPGVNTASAVTPIGSANTTGYELTQEGQTENVKLTAKAE